MAFRVGDIVRLKGETGADSPLFKVISVWYIDYSGSKMCEVIGFNDRGKEVAKLGTDGVVWFRHRDLEENTDPNQGVLL